MATAARNLQAALNIAEKCESVAGVLRALSHPIRLKILSRLVEQERSVNELTEMCATSQSAMSQFLKRMRTEGIVASRREGQFIFYRISDPKLHKLMRAMSDIYC
jgi:DNA-binding transcriptional ArsR family regulator